MYDFCRINTDALESRREPDRTDRSGAPGWEVMCLIPSQSRAQRECVGGRSHLRRQREYHASESHSRDQNAGHLGTWPQSEDPGASATTPGSRRRRHRYVSCRTAFPIHVRVPGNLSVEVPSNSNPPSGRMGLWEKTEMQAPRTNAHGDTAPSVRLILFLSRLREKLPEGKGSNPLRSTGSLVPGGRTREPATASSRWDRVGALGPETQPTLPPSPARTGWAGGTPSLFQASELSLQIGPCPRSCLDVGLGSGWSERKG